MDGLGFFNIGFGELFFILILAGLVLGPHRMRDVALFLGTWVAKFQKISREFVKQLNSELDQEEREALKGAVSDLQALRAEVDSLKAQVREGAKGFITEGNDAVSETSKELKEAKAEIDKLRKMKLNLYDEPEKTIAEKPAEEPTNSIGGFELPKLVSVEDDPA